MVEKHFKCIICGQSTIAPRAHFPIHTVDQITETFVKLTMQNEIKKEEKEKKLTNWNLEA